MKQPQKTAKIRAKMTAFEQKFNKESCFVTEGAPGLRLQREFGLQPDTNAALALTVRSERGRAALGTLWREDCGIALNFGLPFLAAAPARRPDSARAAAGGLGRELTAGNLDFMRSVMRKKRTPPWRRRQTLRALRGRNGGVLRRCVYRAGLPWMRRIIFFVCSY